MGYGTRRTYIAVAAKAKVRAGVGLDTTRVGMLEAGDLVMVQGPPATHALTLQDCE